MKYQAQIVGILILCVVFGALGAVWQFYFKEIFEGYRRDDELRASLETTLSQLEETFHGYKPEVLIEEWQNKMQPWRNAREERATFFSFGDWYDIDVTPDETRMLKFWYDETSNQMIRELYTRVYERMGDFSRFPQDIRASFNIAREEEWGGRDITWEEARVNLQVLAFAKSVTDFLLENNVTAVRHIEFWPRRTPQQFNELLVLQTLGLHIAIQTRDLVRMFDRLRQEPRYFSVEAMKISYPYIAYAVEPQLDVRLLLTQANYRPPDDERLEVAARTAGPGAPSAPARIDRERTGRALDVQPNMLRRFWTWFRRNVLYMP